MHSRKTPAILLLLVCFGTSLFWSRGASAQGLQIMPVTLGLADGQASTTVLVSNFSNATQTVQVRPFLWGQTAGADTLTPTDVVLVSPPITTIAAGAQQVFRILLRQPAERVESSYRLLFDELPSPSDDGGGVRLKLRLSVPLFVQPPARISGGVTWSVLVDSSGATLHAENHDGKHMRIVHPVLTGAASARIAVSAAEVGYVLAGAVHDWPIPDGRRLLPGSVWHLTAASDQGPIDATVHVSPR